jgi:hypothetical protein
MTPVFLKSVSFHTTLLESIAARYRQDNDFEAVEHLEALEIFEGLQERTIEANGHASRLGYHVRKLPSGETYRIRFDRGNKSIEACLDLDVYDALHADNVDARATMFEMVADLMLRFRRLASQGAPSNWRAIDCPRVPEAKDLADAMLLPASGIDQWQAIQPAITPSELASIYRVGRPTAERRLKLFGKRKDSLLAASAGALSVTNDVRLRIHEPGIVRRALSFFIHGDGSENA